MSIILTGTGWLAEQAGAKFLEKFAHNVLERWSQHRRKEFFNSFCDEFRKELAIKEPLSQVDEALEKLINKDKHTEILFEAYRQVSLAKSKTLGPRIIGYLTATLIIKEQEADDDDQMIFEIAEKSSDADLLAFANFYDENVEHSKKADKTIYNVTLNKYGELRILFDKESFNTTWRKEGAINLPPPNLADFIGDWAVRYKNLGVLIEEVSEKTIEYRADSERHIDEDGTERTITWWIIVPSRFKRLRDYIVRANFKSDGTV